MTPLPGVAAEYKQTKSPSDVRNRYLSNWTRQVTAHAPELEVGTSQTEERRPVAKPVASLWSVVLNETRYSPHYDEPGGRFQQRFERNQLQYWELFAFCSDSMIACS